MKPDKKASLTTKAAASNAPTKKVTKGTPSKAAAKNAPAKAVKPRKKTATVSKPADQGQTASSMPCSAPEVVVEITHVEIATRAYFIFLREGRPTGREMQHWLEAEAQLTHL